MDFKSLAKGGGFFLGGYLCTAILEWFVWDVLTAMGGIFSSTELDSTLSLGIIAIYIFLCVIMPSIYIYKGITTEGNLNGYSEAIVGIFLFLFGVLFMIKTWYMTTTFANITTEPLVIALFWIGYIASIGGMFIIAPIYMTIHGMRE